MKRCIQFTLLSLTLLSIQAFANRPCIESDYAPVIVNEYECSFLEKGKSLNLTVYKNDQLGLRLPYERSVFGVANGVKIPYETLNCSNSSVEEQIIQRDGLSVLLHRDLFPEVRVQRIQCHEKFIGYDDYRPIYKYTTSETFETVTCQYVGKKKIDTRQPDISVCGFEDPGY